jgi:mevalonate kinase
LNEFLVDLVEFVQKHFNPPVTRTKVLEENGCAGVIMRHEPSGCEIEVTTLGGAVLFRSGEKLWTVEGADAPELYGKVIEEMLAVFAGRRIGPWGGASRA